MAERLSQIEERIDSVGQLSSVFMAIRGIAAARLREGENGLEGVRAYAQGVGEAIGQALALAAEAESGPGHPRSGGALVIALCSDQGFAGAFNSRVLDVAEQLVRGRQAELFVVGDHGVMAARERGLKVSWSAPMAAHVEQTIELANRLSEGLYDRIGKGTISATIVHASPGQAPRQPIIEKALVPFDFSRFPAAGRGRAPLINLPPGILLVHLAEEYVFAELCEATMLSYAAENEARMRAMMAAHDNVAKRLDELTATARRIRQQEITSEVVELAAAVEANS